VADVIWRNGNITNPTSELTLLDYLSGVMLSSLVYDLAKNSLLAAIFSMATCAEPGREVLARL